MLSWNISCGSRLCPLSYFSLSVRKLPCLWLNSFLTMSVSYVRLGILRLFIFVLLVSYCSNWLCPINFLKSLMFSRNFIAVDFTRQKLHPPMLSRQNALCGTECYGTTHLKFLELSVWIRRSLRHWLQSAECFKKRSHSHTLDLILILRYRFYWRFSVFDLFLEGIFYSEDTLPAEQASNKE